MTRLYLIRHAQAEGNLYRRAQGQYNSHITAMGERQIKALQARFAGIHIDACYASDLYRTQRTAEAIYRPKELPLMLDARLREVCMGCWENHPWGEIKAEQALSHRSFLRCEPDWRVSGGECFPQVTARMAQAIEEIAARHPQQSVAVFSHGMAIRNYIASLLGEQVSTVPHGENTCVSLLQFDGASKQVVYYADAGHLSEDISTLAQQGRRRADGTREDMSFYFRDYKDDEDRAFVQQCHSDAWERIYHEPCPNAELDKAMADTVAHAKQGAVRIVLCEGQTVGLLHLAPELEAQSGLCHIYLFYLKAPYRGSGLGVQLLGEAVSLARAWGRDRLGLYCAHQNSDALQFYRKQGFEQTGTVNTPRGHRLYVLRKPCAAPPQL